MQAENQLGPVHESAVQLDCDRRKSGASFMADLRSLSALSMLGAVAVSGVFADEPSSSTASGAAVHAEQAVPTTLLRGLSAVTTERIKQRAAEFSLVFESYSRGDVPSRIPKFVESRIETILREIPGSEGHLQWSRQRIAAGEPAHILAMLMQDFRNSPEAESVSTIFKESNASQRVILLKELRALTGDELTFGCLFTLPMKPFVIDPVLNPEFRVSEKFPEWRKGLSYVTIKDARGLEVFSGGWESPGRYLEGNYAKLFNSGGHDAVIVDYYCNSQPNFRFYRFDPQGNPQRMDFFKTYLGAKGLFFFYQRSDSDRATGMLLSRDASYSSIAEAQLPKLWRFFRWERGAEGEGIAHFKGQRYEFDAGMRALSQRVLALPVEMVEADAQTRRLLEAAQSQLKAMGAARRSDLFIPNELKTASERKSRAGGVAEPVYLPLTVDWERAVLVIGNRGDLKK